MQLEHQRQASGNTIETAEATRAEGGQEDKGKYTGMHIVRNLNLLRA